MSKGILNKISVTVMLLIIVMSSSCFSQSSEKEGLSEKFGALELKTTYIKTIEKMSFTEALERLEQDRLAIVLSMDSLRGINFNQSGAYSVDPFLHQLVNNDRSDNYFSLLSDDRIKIAVNNIESIQFTQKFRLPNSTFEYKIYSPENLLTTDNVIFEPKEFYLQNKRLILDQLMVQPVDSMMADIKVKYPIQYDSVIIDLWETKSLTYKGIDIKLSYLNNNIVSINVMGELEIIGARGSHDTKGFLKNNSCIAVPVLSLVSEVERNIEQVSMKFKQASQAKNLEEILTLLNTVTEQEFLYATKLTRVARLIDDYYKNYGATEDIIKLIKQEYSLIFRLKFTEYTFKYDANVYKVVLYIGKEFNTVSKSKSIRHEEYGLLPTYLIFKDDVLHKFGIIDKGGNIVVPAQFRDLNYVSDAFDIKKEVHYFTNKEDGIESLYYLDVDKKQLILLEDTPYYFYTVGRSAVLSKGNGGYGVMNGNKIIVPFRYTSVYISKDLFIGIESRDDDITYDFYNSNGELITTDPFSKLVSYNSESSNVVVCDYESKSGMLNKNGKLVVPFKYDKIEIIGKDLYGYRDENSTGVNNVGLMNAQGDRIIPPTYDYIGKIYNGLIPVSKKINKTNKGGFINAKGEEVISLKYDEVHNYVRGYALVRIGTNYFLIDTSGKVIKEFPKNLKIVLSYKDFVGRPFKVNGNVYDGYNTNEERIYEYNYKGELK